MMFMFTSYYIRLYYLSNVLIMIKVYVFIRFYLSKIFFIHYSVLIHTFRLSFWILFYRRVFICWLLIRIDILYSGSLLRLFHESWTHLNRFHLNSIFKLFLFWLTYLKLEQIFELSILYINWKRYWFFISYHNQYYIIAIYSLKVFNNQQNFKGK